MKRRHRDGEEWRDAAVSLKTGRIPDQKTQRVGPLRDESLLLPATCPLVDQAIIVSANAFQIVVDLAVILADCSIHVSRLHRHRSQDKRV